MMYKLDCFFETLFDNLIVLGLHFLFVQSLLLHQH